MEEPRLTHNLNRALKKLQGKYRQFAETYGLAPAQLAALEKLWAENGMTVTGLSARLQLKTSTVTALAARMERDGLIIREKDSNDRRVIKLHLTSKGISLMGQIPDFNLFILDTIKDGMPDGYVKTLDHLLQQFCVALDG